MTRTITSLFCLLAACIALSAAPSNAQAVQFGAWTPGSPFGGHMGAINNLESSLGRRVAIVNWFQDFSTRGHHFRWNIKKATKGVARSGRKPLLTWEPFDPNNSAWERWSNRAIIRGDHDAYIKKWARKVKKLRTPLYVRFAHEANGGWFPWGGIVNGNSPKSYKRMWRHVVKLVRKQGARNVKWVWSPLCEDQAGAPKLGKYYPGRKYVDVLGMSGFNWGDQFGGWRSFKKVFKKGYKKLSRIGPQPIWITEVASASTGGDKAKWVRDMWSTAAKWKRLKAIVWFNQDKERDWSTAAVASSFAG